MLALKDKAAELDKIMDKRVEDAFQFPEYMPEVLKNPPVKAAPNQELPKSAATPPIQQAVSGEEIRARSMFAIRDASIVRKVVDPYQIETVLVKQAAQTQIPKLAHKLERVLFK